MQLAAVRVSDAIGESRAQSAERRAQRAESKARRQRAQFRTSPAARRSSHQRLRLPLRDLGGRTRASVPLPFAAGWSRRSPCSRRAPQIAAPRARSVAPLAPTAPRGSVTAQWQGQKRAGGERGSRAPACRSTKRDYVIAVVRGWRGAGGGWRVAAGGGNVHAHVHSTGAHAQRTWDALIMPPKFCTSLPTGQGAAQRVSAVGDSDKGRGGGAKRQGRTDLLFKLLPVLELGLHLCEGAVQLRSATLDDQ